MPSTQKKLNLIAKSAKSAGNQSPQSSQDNMADDMRPFFGQVDADSLVERITAKVLEGVEVSFDKKIDPALKKLEACSSKIATLDTRITEAEGRISNSEDTAAIHITKLAEVESKLEAAMDKIDDLENRSRWCNIRVIGLPEGSEGANPVAFFRTWLPELLKVGFKGGSVKVDRCHRALARRPPPDQRPRAVILKLHNFQDKVRIMQAARKTQPLVYNSAPIMIFEDFSAAVLRKRQEFYQVKQQLKERGIAYAMLYPAVLRIKHNGQEKVFKHPKEVAAFLDKEPQRGGSSPMFPAD